MSSEHTAPQPAAGSFGLLRGLTLLGAALLFTLEPLVAKLLVPSCGGAFHVWATCLTFFQGMLFLGYLYCLVLPRIGRAHLLVLFLPLLAMRVTPLGNLAAIPDPAAPTGAILWALLRDVGLPFFALSTTSVAAQTWLARSTLPQRNDPYRLYSASNLGSLVGLLAYPLIWERLTGLHAQRVGWSVGYGLYLLVACATFARKLHPITTPVATGASTPRTESSNWRQRGLWFLLSAIPSAFLVSATGRLVEDLGNVPLVWVLPLVIYLGTFVLLFGRRNLVPAWVMSLAPVGSALGLWAFVSYEALTWYASLVHLGALASVCLLLHGALHTSRPPSERLGGYWLVVSLGGWVGGACATFVAPLVFSGLWDYPLLIVLSWLLLLRLGWRRALGALGRSSRVWAAFSVGAWVVVGSGVAHGLVAQASAPPVLDRLRNFYGIYRVTAATFQVAGSVRTLHHGSTVHGRQIIDNPQVAISYYSPLGPWGDVYRMLDEDARSAIVGLGVGGLSAYNTAPRSMVYFELDPDNEIVARKWFGYLEAASGETELVAGDARISLALDERPPYDLLAMDAFCGDAIPTHLLTREAFELYLNRLADDGLLLVHVSNRYYDLAPVVADSRPPELHAVIRRVGPPGPPAELPPPLQAPCHLIALSRSQAQLEKLIELGTWTPLEEPTGDFLWTDDHADLLGALR